MYKCGSIILLNNKKGWFPFLVRFFTKGNYTHNAITMGSIIPECESILTAEQLITVHPLERYFQNPNYEFEIYEWNDSVIKENELKEIVMYLYKDRVSKGYAYLQKIWYIYRYIAEAFGFDVRKHGNWFPANDDCSEETYDLMKKVAERISDKRLLNKLNEWNSNCFHPVDSKLIVSIFSNLLTQVH